VKRWANVTCDLSAVKLLIVDEADEVFAAEGAGKELPLLQEILKCVTEQSRARPNVLLMSATFEQSAQENFKHATRGAGAWLGTPSTWSVVEVNQRGGCSKKASWDPSTPLLESSIAGNNQCVEFELEIASHKKEEQFRIVKQTIGECSFMYRYIVRESCSQFDSLPLTYLTIPGTLLLDGVAADAVGVSVLLCTVTFYANLAHSLTRSP
jgi:hypothetical protein